MKVKVVTGKPEGNLEKEINSFLENNPGIEVMDILQSASNVGSSNQGIMQCAVTIWYVEKNDNSEPKSENVREETPKPEEEDSELDNVLPK